MKNNESGKSRGTVLVVEDDGGLRDLIVRLLRRSGYEAAGFADGAEALAQITTNLPDALLLDQNLPGMTGRQIIAALADRGIKIPFIVMTGQGNERLAVEMMKLGALDYLVKDTDFLVFLPMSIDRLFRAIEAERALRQAEAEKEQLQLQLIQAQKMESVGRLAGGVAHEFNNMLTVIIGNIELAKGHPGLDEEQQGMLQEALAAARRSADVTRQLLAFSRKQMAAPLVLDVNETVQAGLKMIRRLIGEDIDLEWQPAPALRPVKIDPTQIDQIMTNLCLNARDAIAGAGRITIVTENVTLDESDCARHQADREDQELLPGCYVLLTVSDDGCGMDAETLSRLFEPFFTTKEVGQGTGLGLPTIYGIVLQNNGLVQVESEPGRGTTFKIHLPCHDAPSAPAPEEKRGQAITRGGLL